MYNEELLNFSFPACLITKCRLKKLHFTHSEIKTKKRHLMVLLLMLILISSLNSSSKN